MATCLGCQSVCVSVSGVSFWGLARYCVVVVVTGGGAVRDGAP